MGLPVPDAVTACIGKECGSYWAGHLMHHIHARRVGETPWGWRDAIVVAMDGRAVRLAYVDGSGAPVVWHHRRLAGIVAPGDPVRLHEQYYALGCPHGWFNVVVEDGVGAVPKPEDAAARLAETTAGIVDLSTGIALPTDHVEPVEPRDDEKWE